MKRLGWIGLLVLLFAAASCDSPGPTPAVVGSTSASTQQSEGSGPALDRGTAFFTLGEHEIVINYGRPSLQGRDMLGQIQPGDIWRLGMNEATEFETTTALKFGDKQIPAGRYTIFAKYLGDKSWNLVFNSKIGQWGAFEYDSSQDVGQVPLSVKATDNSIDRLTISMEPLADDQGRLVIAWGTQQLVTDFQLP